jgi:hypothetical protein
MMAMLVLASGCYAHGAGDGVASVVGYVGDNPHGPRDPILDSEGTESPNRPVPTSTQTDAETARIASTAWRAAFHGDCDQANDAMQRVATRDPAYFNHLALDPTFEACRQ